jgi:hypothetical protein
MKTKLAFIIILMLLGVMACSNNPTKPSVIVPILIGNPADGSALQDPTYITAMPGSGYLFRKIEFYIDSALVATDSIAPFQYLWNVFTYTSGTSYSIYAVGTTSDTSYTSQTIHVTPEFTRGFSFISTYQPGSQHALGVANYYNVLFISTGDAGLEVLDITTKAQPLFRSRLVTTGPAQHAAILFPYVYIADRDQGVEMADFENVDSLTPTHRYTSQSQARDVAVSDNIILAAENDGLSILSPTNLALYSRRVFQDLLNYVVARHDTAFIVGNSGFYIVNCTNPSASLVIATYNLPGQGLGVAVIDTFAFIAVGSDGVIALSIAHPASPRFLARYSSGQIMTAVTAGDGVLFAGSNSSAVYALDYKTHPDNLVLIDRMDVNSTVTEIAHSPNYIYVATNSNVEILRFIP